MCNQIKCAVFIFPYDTYIFHNHRGKLSYCYNFTAFNTNLLSSCDSLYFQAEAWMREQAQAEGWVKAGKLAERPMSQGLVGLIEDGNSATIVEVTISVWLSVSPSVYQSVCLQLSLSLLLR